MRFEFDRTTFFCLTDPFRSYSYRTKEWFRRPTSVTSRHSEPPLHASFCTSRSCPPPPPPFFFSLATSAHHTCSKVELSITTSRAVQCHAQSMIIMLSNRRRRRWSRVDPLATRPSPIGRPPPRSERNTSRAGMACPPPPSVEVPGRGHTTKVEMDHWIAMTINWTTRDHSRLGQSTRASS